jgi:uncharacterized membrane protein SirB2
MCGPLCVGPKATPKAATSLKCIVSTLYRSGPAMQYYPLLKNIHVLLALTSGIGFALRGFIRLVLRQALVHRFWKVAPHIVDTLLLASGVTLWVVVGWPLMSWLGVKLLLVLTYILLGIAAFKARDRSRAVGFYLVALCVFIAVAALALHKPL